MWQEIHAQLLVPFRMNKGSVFLPCIFKKLPIIMIDIIIIKIGQDI